MKDHIKYSSVVNLKANLDDLSEKLRKAGQVLKTRHELGLGSHVYPEISRSTAEQLHLLGKHLEEPIEITASICRTVFEINIVFRYCLSSTERLKAYASQAGTDEISIYKSLKRLADEETDPKNINLIDEHINHVRNVLQKHNLSQKADRPSIFQMAKEVGQKDEYDAMYGIYSKYVHASAWFILRKREHIDLPMYRMAMQLHTQLYASDTLSRLTEIHTKRIIVQGNEIIQ